MWHVRKGDKKRTGNKEREKSYRERAVEGEKGRGGKKEGGKKGEQVPHTFSS